MASNTQPIAVIARLLDLTERRVQQLAREGVIPPAARSGPSAAATTWSARCAAMSITCVSRPLESQSGTRRTSVPSGPGWSRPRPISPRWMPAPGAATCCRRHEVEAAWIAVLERLRARLLVLPDRLAPLVHEETTIAGARASIRETIAEALTELSSLPVDRAPDPEGEPPPDPGGAPVADNPDAAAGADDRGLG